MPLVAAFATSHAYTFQEPETWDTRRERSKANVAKKNAGRLAPDTREAQAETLADNRARYAAIREAHAKIRDLLKRARADAVLLVGDDQAENFTADNMPQLLVYTGGTTSPTTGTASTPRRSGTTRRSRRSSSPAQSKKDSTCAGRTSSRRASSCRTPTPSRSCT